MRFPSSRLEAVDLNGGRVTSVLVAVAAGADRAWAVGRCFVDAEPIGLSPDGERRLCERRVRLRLPTHVRQQDKVAVTIQSAFSWRTGMAAAHAWAERSNGVVRLLGFVLTP